MKSQFLRQYTILLIIFCTNLAIAQVGINTKNPATTFHIDAKGDNTSAIIGTDDVVFDTQGRLGIGMAPIYTSPLQINGGITLKDGTQGIGKVLMSDAAGNASWGEAVLETQSIPFPSGITIPYNATGYLQSGVSLSLPPGRYAINTSLLFRTDPIVDIPQNTNLVVRYTFSDSGAALGATASADLENTKYMLADVVESSRHGFSVGTFIINNSTSGNKRYYLIGGDITSRNIALSGGLSFGMSFFLENGIVVYKLSN